MLRNFITVGVILFSFVSAVSAESPQEGKYFKRGNSRLERADYEGAIADFDKVIEETPALAEAYRLRGFVYQQLKKNDLAMADFNKAIEIDPQSTSSLSSRARYLYELAMYKAAIDDFSRVIKLDPESLTAWNWLGAANESEGDLVAAIKCYVKATSLSPDFVNAWENLGSTYRKLGMTKESIEAYGKAIEFEPNQTRLFNIRALTRVVGGDFEAAIADLNEAIRLDPTNSSPLLNRFLALVYLGRNEEARQDAEAYLKLVKDGRDSLVSLSKELIPIYQKAPNPKTAEDYRKRGEALSAAGYKLQAICDFRKAVQIDEFNTGAFTAMARLFTSQRYYSAAIDTYLKCIEADDRFALAYEEIGEVYRHYLKQIDESFKWYDKAIALGSVDGYAERGIAKSAKNDLTGAISDLSRAIELNPKMTYAWSNRAECYVKMGKLTEATTDVETAITLSPNWWYSFAVRGLIKKAKKDFPGAIADLNESMKQHRNERNLMYRGLTLLEMGNSVEAQADFDELLKLDPTLKSELENQIAKLGTKQQVHVGYR
jgi:tetratricopeptide (TPR) repeat protein